MTSTQNTAIQSETCGDCGRAATGFASINDVRFCHGDDDPAPTCYERNTWRLARGVVKGTEPAEVVIRRLRQR